MSTNPVHQNDGLPPGYTFRPEYEVTPRQAMQMLKKGEVFLLDCRTREEWDLVHIEGSVHIPLSELDNRADEVEPDGRAVAVICHHGVRSLKAALLLRERGFPGALSVVGGIEAWSLGADPSVPRYERNSAFCRLIP